MKNEARGEVTAGWVEETIRNFLRDPAHNNLATRKPEKAWGEPLVGFSSGADTLYDDLKRDIGEFYWTPLDIFKMTFPELAVFAAELTVVSWILPQTEVTKADNRREAFFTAERWARARIFGEEANVKLREHVVAALRDRGCPAVAPMLSPLWDRRISERYGFASNWSERHVAFVSGLGTFGLCDGLITSVGKAMRCGSVVARIRIPPTPRPYATHTEYCPFLSDGTCGKCISRCPVGAISEAGHDKEKCGEHVHTTIKDYVTMHYGLEGYGCGLCQTGVPCESGIPARGRNQKSVRRSPVQ